MKVAGTVFGDHEMKIVLSIPVEFECCNINTGLNLSGVAGFGDGFVDQG